MITCNCMLTNICNKESSLTQCGKRRYLRVGDLFYYYYC